MEIDLGADLGDIQGEYDLVDEGMYLFRVNDFRKRERRDKSGSFLNLEAEIVDTLEEALEMNVGRPHYEVFSLSEKALWKVKAFLSAVSEEEVKGSKIDTDQIKGRCFVGTLYKDTYNGQERMKLRRMKSASGWDGIFCTVDETGELTIDAEGQALMEAANERRAKAKEKQREDFSDDGEVEI